MIRLRKFFFHLKNVIAYNHLRPEERVLTFYSEGQNYWSYLGGLVKTILSTSDITICYVTSSNSDPGLEIDNPRLKTFVIGEGYIRDWMFANMDTKVMVMTMPDLDQYQVKRSKHPVHYVYVQHSLVSFHMVYRPGAFDAFDTIFCSGAHHLAEMREIEKAKGLAPKNLFEHGYARLDIIKNDNSQKTRTDETSPTHYLLAPSWGEHGTIETGVGASIVRRLLANGAKVTLRPHPQTIKFFNEKVQEIVDEHQGNANFNYENNVRGTQSLKDSDVMICDWSGAALDYAFGLEKPVLFVDVPRKVNNPGYEDMPIEPFEVQIRNEIGMIIDPDDLQALETFKVKPLPKNIADKYVFNVGKSDAVGAKEIIRIVQEQIL